MINILPFNPQIFELPVAYIRKHGLVVNGIVWIKDGPNYTCLNLTPEELEDKLTERSDSHGSD